MKEALLVMAALNITASVENIDIVEIVINDETIYYDYYARYFDGMDFDLEDQLMAQTMANACPYLGPDEDNEIE